MTEPAGRQVDFDQQVTDVRLDRASAELQPFRDAVVREVLRYQLSTMRSRSDASCQLFTDR
jgi:hypothetical protein